LVPALPPVGLDLNKGQGNVWEAGVAQMGFILRTCRREFASTKNVMRYFCKLFIVDGKNQIIKCNKVSVSG